MPLAFFSGGCGILLLLNQFVCDMVRGRKIYEVKQHDDSDCAAACLSSVCSFYGRHLPIVEIRDRCGATEHGTTVQGIVDAAVRLGLEASALKAPEKKWEMLSAIDRPAVVHLRKAGGWLHFVVMYGWHGDYVSVMDPSVGKIVRSGREDFMNEWSGYLVVLSPSPEFIKEDRTTDVRGHLRRILCFRRTELSLAFTGAAVYVLTGLSSSVFIQRILDVVIPERNAGMLSVFAAAMAVMTAASFAVSYLRTIFTVKAGLETDLNLVTGYMRRLLSLPVTFFSPRSTGELNSRIKDVYRVRNFLTVRLMVIGICVLTLLLSCVLMFTFCWKLASVVLAYIPVYIIIYRLSDTVTKKMNRKVMESGAAYDAESVDVLTGIRTIRYLGWQDVFMRRIEERYSAFVTDSWTGSRYVTGFTVASDTAAGLLSYIILMLGTVLVFRDILSVGELVSFHTVTSFFSVPVKSLIESNNDLTQAYIASERLFEIMDLEPEDRKEGTASVDASLPWNILSMENISFSYPGGPALIKDLSVSISSGSFTAVTGANGSGKSTLAMLLMRGAEPMSGRILLDGKDIRDFSLSEWRSFVSIVPQKAELFRGSILENIAPGDRSPDAGKIASLCMMADFDLSLKKFPEGIMTQVGEGGCRLSGGERQKVALVRTLYRDPRIIIMDEAAASVDRKGRERLLALLKMLVTRGRTIIMITHDDFFLTAADRVVRLANNN